MKWNPKTKRYHGPNGRFIERERVLEFLEYNRTAAKARVRALSESLANGKINLAQWTIQMRAEMKAAHLTASAVAQGGLKQLSPAQLGRIGAQTRKQYEYLRNFERQLANGLPMDGRFLMRAEMYMAASHSTFAEAERRMMEDAGHDEERRVLHAVESCPGCLTQAGKGWQPLGKLEPIGAEECRVNCRCEWQTRKAA